MLLIYFETCRTIKMLIELQEKEKLLPFSCFWVERSALLESDFGNKKRYVI